MVDLKGQLSNLLSDCSGLFKAVDLWREEDKSSAQATPSLPARRIKRHRRLHPNQIDALVAEYQAGATVLEVAKSYQIHRTTVLALLERAGVSRRYQRLSAEQTAEAAQLYEAGNSLVVVAARFEVDASTVWRALRQAGVTLRDQHGRTCEKT